MSIQLASWNVEGRLSGYAAEGRGSAEHILSGITRLNADIVVLPEAYLENPAPGVDDSLRSLGYVWHDVAYGLHERDWSEEFLCKVPSMRVLSKLPIHSITESSWGGVRSMLSFTVSDPDSQVPIRIHAVHLDDRSEALRERQVEAAIEQLAAEELPIIAIGDFNAMWHKGRAWLIGSKAARIAARSIPYSRLRHTVTRLTDMASGRALARLAVEAELRDADPRHYATATPKMRDMLFMPSIPLVQIDHALVSERVIVSDFSVSRDIGSDHRAVCMKITAK